VGGVVEALGQAREHPPELAHTYFERRSGAMEAELEQAIDLYRFADDRAPTTRRVAGPEEVHVPGPRIRRRQADASSNL
jgi:hypothetical protein